MFGLNINATIHVHHHGDVAGVNDKLARLLKQGEDLMSKISEFADKMAEHNTKVDTAVEGLVGDVNGLKEQITALQNSAGQITPEDQALLDAIEQRAGVVAEKLAALDALTPPSTPTP